MMRGRSGAIGATWLIGDCAILDVVGFQAT